jgi:hypothetical protein
LTGHYAEHPMSGIGNKDWRELYQDALLETDLSRLPERVELASEALQKNLRALTGSPEDFRQRDILLDALRTLHALRREKP